MPTCDAVPLWVVGLMYAIDPRYPRKRHETHSAFAHGHGAPFASICACVQHMIRATTIFRGRVQGVGFRATAAHCARAYPVTGFVRNEPDGSVLCIAEGTSGDVEAFLDAVRQSMRCNIAASDSTLSAASGEFVGFVIRR